LEQFLDQQAEICKFAKKHPELGINPRAFLVFDDDVDQHLRYKVILDKIFFNGRHVKIFVLISSQYVKSLHPGVRSNVDIVFTFCQRSLLERQALADQYLDAFPTDSVFQLLDNYAKIDQEKGFHQFVVCISLTK